MKLAKIKSKLIVFVLAVLMANSVFADGLLTNKQGNFIHTIFFNLPDNKDIEARVDVAFGQLMNNSCQYTKSLGPQIVLITNNEGRGPTTIMGFSNETLKQYVGNGYTCGTFSFTHTKKVNDSFQLIWDGKNYTAAIPPVVTIKLQ